MDFVVRTEHLPAPEATAKAMEGINLQTEAQRCGEDMKRRGAEMQEAGKALQAQAPASAK